RPCGDTVRSLRESVVICAGCNRNWPLESRPRELAPRLTNPKVTANVNVIMWGFISFTSYAFDRRLLDGRVHETDLTFSSLAMAFDLFLLKRTGMIMGICRR